MISPNRIKRRRARGFSLTEVAIAIATVSVSLVALLGLVSVTLQTGKSSASETSMTTASHQALDVLRALPFGDIPYEEPPTQMPEPGSEEKATTPTILPTVYIAEDGQWLAPDRSKWPETQTDTTQPPEAVYKCVVTLEPDEATLTPPALSSTVTRVNLLRVQLALSPVVALPNSKPAVQIHATIPRP